VVDDGLSLNWLFEHYFGTEMPNSVHSTSFTKRTAIFYYNFASNVHFTLQRRAVSDMYGVLGQNVSLQGEMVLSLASSKSN
jgi:hypothetical protein